MLCKRLIPCLDVRAGRVVKGVRFVNLRDAGDPVEAAQAYDQQGADELVFLDITASHEGRAIMLEVVRRTAEGIYMPLTVGGGGRTGGGGPGGRWSVGSWLGRRPGPSGASASWWPSTRSGSRRTTGRHRTGPCSPTEGAGRRDGRPCAGGGRAG